MFKASFRCLSLHRNYFYSIQMVFIYMPYFIKKQNNLVFKLLFIKGLHQISQSKKIKFISNYSEFNFDLVKKSFAHMDQKPLRDFQRLQTENQNQFLPTASKKSQFSIEYHQRLSKFIYGQQKNLEGMNFQSHNLSYFDKQFKKTLDLKVKRTSVSNEVVVLTARWGFFQTDIKILNIADLSLNHSKRSLCSQANRVLYKMEYNNKYFIKKCIETKNKLHRQEAIKEWFMLKVCSALKIGPYVQRYLGFDLLMHQNCTEFAMEPCEEAHQQNLTLSQLYENLELMHRLHIVHQDIKPPNIMFSPKFKKMVFIDFGLSTMVEEKLGQKTLTTFVGTWNFCTKQMSQSLNSNNAIFVDLYYNDLYCLTHSIEYIRQLQKYQDLQMMQEDHNIQILQKEVERNNIQSYQVKFLLYEKLNQIKKHELINLLNKTIPAAEILSFMKEVPYHENLQHYFFNYVSEEYSETILYNQIKYVYRSANQHNTSLNFQADQTKMQFFNSFYEPLGLQLNFQKSLSKRVEKLKSIVLSQQTIRKTSFYDYVSAYLDYISFHKNICGNSIEERLAAAKIYSQIFMGTQQNNQKGNRLIAKTIQNITEKYLYHDQVSYLSSESIASIFLSLYDFLSILDCGTTCQYFKWLNDMFHHLKMQLIQKYLLLMKVAESLDFYQKNTKSRKGESRYEFLARLQVWIQSKKKGFSDKFNVQKIGDDDFSIYEIDLASKKQRKIFISHVLSDNYDFSYIYITLRQKEFSVESILKSLLRRNKWNSFPKINHYIPKLLTFYAQWGSLDLYNGIVKIIENNIKDKQILESFKFSFHQNTLIPFIQSSKIESTTKIVQKISEYFLSMQEPYLLENMADLQLFFNHMLYKSRFFQKQRQNRQTLLKNVISQLLLIFPAYFYKKIKQTNINMHICLRPAEIFNFISMCKIINPQIVSNFQISCMNYKDEIQCQKCKIILSINHNLICMQKCITLESKATKQAESVLKYNIKQKFDQIYHILSSPNSQTIFSRTQRQFFIQKSFHLLLLFCTLNEQLEKEYKGIYNYYCKCKLKSNFFNYFNSADRRKVIIFSTLQTLQKYYPEEYIYFLFKLTEVVQFKCFSKHSVDIFFILRVFISHHHQDTLIATYLKISELKKGLSNRYPNIGILYNVIFNLIKNPIYKQKIAVNILGLIDYMEIFWAREARLYLIDYQTQKIKNDKSKERKLNYLVKKYIFRVFGARGQLYTIKKKKEKLKRKVSPKQLLRCYLITLDKKSVAGYQMKVRTN